MPPRALPLVAALPLAFAASCGGLASDDSDTLPDAAPEDAPGEDAARDVADLPADAEPEADAVADAPADLPGDAGPPCGPFPGGECSAGEVCDIRSCLPGAAGTCIVRPAACSEVLEPVCGCDGATYGNDCERLRAGAALAHDGDCGSGSLCGGSAGFRCPAGEVCDIHGCWPDASGTCVPAPDPCDTRFDPVCGCDGVTYGNDCARLAAGVALDHPGACETVAPCAPVCRVFSEEFAWVDPCTDRVFCTADCLGCTAECRAAGSDSEGWYASCPHGTGGGGCRATALSNLIEWTDCSP